MFVCLESGVLFKMLVLLLLLLCLGTEEPLTEVLKALKDLIP